MSGADHLADEILTALSDDFGRRALTADDLHQGYEGLAFSTLRDRFAQPSAVDFDLAMKALEKSKLIATGPRVPYENDPNSGVFILGLYSKNEYAYLTEAGYRHAQRLVSKPKQTKSPPSVKITGSTFFQSPVGIGENITQSVNVHNDEEVIQYLVELAKSAGHQADQIRADVEQLVAIAKSGEMAKGKPLFQKLYGIASEGVRQLAWGVLSALIASQLGIG